jgi:hypothetical protein
MGEYGVLGYLQETVQSGTLCRKHFQVEGDTADPSTTLRSGRDDNSVWERCV